MTVLVFGYLILISMGFYNFLFFSEKIYQMLKTVFDKCLKVCRKYSVMRHIFRSLLCVWKCGQTQSFMFDLIYQTRKIVNS